MARASAGKRKVIPGRRVGRWDDSARGNCPSKSANLTAYLPVTRKSRLRGCGTGAALHRPLTTAAPSTIGPTPPLDAETLGWRHEVCCSVECEGDRTRGAGDGAGSRASRRHVARRLAQFGDHRFGRRRGARPLRCIWPPPRPTGFLGHPRAPRHAGIAHRRCRRQRASFRTAHRPRRGRQPARPGNLAVRNCPGSGPLRRRDAAARRRCPGSPQRAARPADRRRTARGGRVRTARRGGRPRARRTQRRGPARHRRSVAGRRRRRGGRDQRAPAGARRGRGRGGSPPRPHRCAHDPPRRGALGECQSGALAARDREPARNPAPAVLARRLGCGAAPRPRPYRRCAQQGNAALRARCARDAGRCPGKPARPRAPRRCRQSGARRDRAAPRHRPRGALRAYAGRKRRRDRGGGRGAVAQDRHVRVGAPDAASIDHLERAIAELRSITNRVASGDALATLAEEVRVLAEKIDRTARRTVPLRRSSSGSRR